MEIKDAPKIPRFSRADLPASEEEALNPMPLGITQVAFKATNAKGLSFY